MAAADDELVPVELDSSTRGEGRLLPKPDVRSFKAVLERRANASTVCVLSRGWQRQNLTAEDGGRSTRTSLWYP